MTTRLIRIRPVSYTHLDVYKRQVCDIVKDPAEKNDIAVENRDLIDRAIAILDKEYKPAPGFQMCIRDSPYPIFPVLILMRRCKKAVTSRNRAIPPIML